jgi:hypothetical protein
MTEYRQVAIPDHRRRGKWLSLIEALVAAEGKALHVRRGESPGQPQTLYRQCIARGFDLHYLNQPDGSQILWLTRRRPA